MKSHRVPSTRIESERHSPKGGTMFSALRIAKAVRTVIIAVAATAGMIASVAGSALAASEAPLAERALQLVGWEVNKGTKGPLCNLVEPQEECQWGTPSEKPSGFRFLEGVAVGPAPEHLVYVADKVNSRVQVFTEAGVFVSMFGWQVNEGGSDVCTKTEEGKCRRGQFAAGGPAGAIAQPTSVTVDQSTGDLYVLDYIEHRIEKYSASGEFLYMLGREVNKKDKKLTICTKAEEAECQSGVERARGAIVPGWFKPMDFRGNLLAVDTSGMLYVGDERGVQEFDSTGEFVKEIPLPGIVSALAVGPQNELFLTQEEASKSIYKFNSAGVEVTDGGWPLKVTPKESVGVLAFGVDTLTTDGQGRLAVALSEQTRNSKLEVKITHYGALFTGTAGEPISSFSLEEIVEQPVLTKGIAFGTEDVGKNAQQHWFLLFAATEFHAMVAYEPVAIGELKITGESCQESAEVETDVRLNCELQGTVNPWGVDDTSVWFEWGRSSALGERTSKQEICSTPCGTTPIPASATIEGVRPNEAGFYFQMAGEDANDRFPESFESIGPKEVSFTTGLVPPLIVGQPAASHVRPTAVVLSAEVNPENAETEYFFEFAPATQTLSERCPGGVRHEACEGVGITPVKRARCNEVAGTLECVYGLVGTAIEASGLRPDTAYGYRLFAQDKDVANEASLTSIGPEGTFKSARIVEPQVTTGDAGNVGQTSAIVSGTVLGQGLSTTYTFELGVYDGAATEYGTVKSGTVTPVDEAVGEVDELSGLQPGTTYAYRITAENGAGRVVGQTVLFTTVQPGAPLGVEEVRLLPVPKLPRELRCKHGYRLDRHGQCLKTKHRKRHGRHARRKR